MYEKHEPSALFHGLHHAHKRRVAEEQASRGLGDLGSPMLLLSLFSAETCKPSDARPHNVSVHNSNRISLFS